MAARIIRPSNVHWMDDRGGNHYQVFTVTHDSGGGANTTNVEVDLGAVSVAELPTSGNGLAKTAVTLSDSTAEDGKTSVEISAATTNGTYTIMVRYIGSAAGVRSSNEVTGL